MVTLGVFHFRRFQAAVASRHLELDHLGGAGFTADVGILTPHNLGRAAVGGAAHGLHNKFERFRFCRHMPANFARGVIHQLRFEQVAPIEQG